MKTYIRSIAAVAAVVVLLGMLSVNAIRAEQENTAPIVAALHDYETAAKFGTRADKEAARAFLLQTLQRAEGR